MLKKVGHISLIILLLLATGGVNIYRHYCGTVLMKETVQILPESCCSDHCKSCHNEALHLKVTDNFVTSDITVDFKNYFSALLDNFQLHQILLGIEVANLTQTSKLQIVKHSFPFDILAENSEAHLQVFRL